MVPRGLGQGAVDRVETPTLGGSDATPSAAVTSADPTGVLAFVSSTCESIQVAQVDAKFQFSRTNFRLTTCFKKLSLHNYLSTMNINYDMRRPS
jgi:hypothetical protein